MLISTILLSRISYVSVSSFCDDTAKLQFKSDTAGISNQQFVGHCFGVKCIDYSCYVVYLNDYYNWHMTYESHERLACSVSDVSSICISFQCLG